MHSRARNRRINGTALESIMQDVLRGMQDFTREACSGCNAGGLEILGVEAAGDVSRRLADLLPFPAARDGNSPGN